MRLYFIDSLRGIAAFCVLIQHLVVHYYRDSSTPEWLREIFKQLFIDGLDLGRFGVVLFFLISGFVIPYSLSGERAIFKFTISRFFRLYPPYWFGLLAVIMVDGFFLGKNIDLITILKNITMIPKVFGGYELSGVYWTLFIELIFYFFCAVFFGFNVLGNVIFVSIFCAALVLASFLPILLKIFGGFDVPVQYLTYHLSFLFVGYLLRHFLYEENKVAKYGSIVLISLQLTAIPFVSGIVSPLENNSFNLTGGFGMVSAYWAAVIVFCLSIFTARPIKKPFLVLGRSSYSMYLLHWPVCALVMPLFSFSSVGIMSAFLCSIVCSLLLAEMSYRFLERPSISISKSIFARVNLSSSSSSSAST